MFVRIIIKYIKIKKLIAFFLLAAMMSCSSEDQGNQNVATLAKTSESVLDGKVLSFKDDDSFAKEYSGLAALKSDELQNWISSKKVVSLLNASDDSKDMEEDIIPESRVIYSDALKSILNSESKVKIGGKVLWLNGRNFYLLSENEINKSSQELLSIKDNLEVYGKLLSISRSGKSLTSRNVIPNENRTKTFITEEGSFNVPNVRFRHILDLFNETIVLNNVVQSSKMYLRFALQYRSCSTFSCTWKTAQDQTQVETSLSIGDSIFWNLSPFIDNPVVGSKTFLLSTWTPKIPYNEQAWYTNFKVSGVVRIYVVNAWHQVELSWY